MSMWSDASTTAVWTALSTSVGSVLALTVAAVATVAAGLMGIGYGFRLIKRHVTGRKF